MTATTSDSTPLSTAPYPRDAARGIARAFLPRHPLGNRYDYYYTLTKLRTDPLYPGVLQALRPTSAPVLDLGCGLGLLAHALRADGQVLPYAGVDIDAAKIRRGREVAARAGLADVQLDVLDLAAGLPAHRGSVAILDVLQYLSHERQRALLDEVIAMLAPDALLVIRSGLADGSTRSRTSRITDRLANFAGWMQERARCYPTADGLRTQLEGAGLATTLRPLYGDTPFNNWLIVGRRT
ncbi:class I SAM-dependent methyltransferase [Luteimonas sp. RC10]|uniref:class I SAM-dependent methyltransferase n=1 Tax=Luteimonas sp. RC10 TaxID=2587035 RepID=UPI001618728D|nr:class I SAM-dependent methyltransferase [Luteimonas sp. RC10]MBB3344779.1 SAM-dependent methyltransferase [Luteimonas sp. RC10]